MITCSTFLSTEDENRSFLYTEDGTESPVRHFSLNVTQKESQIVYEFDTRCFLGMMILWEVITCFDFESEFLYFDPLNMTKYQGFTFDTA